MNKNYFRARSIKTSEWVYGYVYPYIRKNCSEDWLMRNLRETGNASFIIDPDTICQYTGMNDINEKMIFEGDIIKYTDDSTHCPHPSYKEDCITDVKYEQGAFYPLAEHETVDVEVIGNVFNDSELLES